MPSFVVEPADISPPVLVLRGPEARHAVKVRRYGVGDVIEASDGDGTYYRARIEALVEDQVRCQILAVERERGESGVRVVLAAALLKGQRFDFLVEKATEVGVDTILPVCTKRCVALSGSGRKVERWRRLAREAAKQCGRTRTPDIEDPLSFTAAIQTLSERTERTFVALPAAPGGLEKGLSGGAYSQLGLCIGPEGGFAPEEEAEALELGLVAFSWGERILRAETAGAVLAALLIYEAERADRH
jgi:16S rRNA (uracil1498-N3)-methyltransferase